MTKRLAASRFVPDAAIGPDRIGDTSWSKMAVVFIELSPKDAVQRSQHKFPTETFSHRIRALEPSSNLGNYAHISFLGDQHSSACRRGNRRGAPQPHPRHSQSQYERIHTRRALMRLSSSHSSLKTILFIYVRFGDEKWRKSIVYLTG